MATDDSYIRAAKESLIWLLKDFSDFDRTAREWRGLEPEVCRSYDEDLALFFDTYQARYFSTEGCASLGFTEEQCKVLRRFVELLANYDRLIRRGPIVSSEYVLSDPTWRTITVEAAKALTELERK